MEGPPFGHSSPPTPRFVEGDADLSLENVKITQGDIVVMVPKDLTVREGARCHHDLPSCLTISSK